MQQDNEAKVKGSITFQEWNRGRGEGRDTELKSQGGGRQDNRVEYHSSGPATRGFEPIPHSIQAMVETHT